MADQVHVYPKLERQLSQLEGQTNAPAVAAQRARTIIDNLIRGEVPASSGLMKARTDRRVKNSLKFNLGQGFRLICIQEKGDVYVMFVGDHDSSDAWLDHYTRKRPHMTDADYQVFCVAAEEFSAMDDTDFWPLEEDPSEELFLPDVPQDMLRRVFSGLCAAG